MGLFEFDLVDQKAMLESWLVYIKEFFVWKKLKKQLLYLNKKIIFCFMSSLILDLFLQYWYKLG